jgi:hypothetical protein
MGCCWGCLEEVHMDRLVFVCCGSWWSSSASLSSLRTDGPALGPFAETVWQEPEPEKGGP